MIGSSLILSVVHHLSSGLDETSVIAICCYALEKIVTGLMITTGLVPRLSPEWRQKKSLIVHPSATCTVEGSRPAAGVVIDICPCIAVV